MIPARCASKGACAIAKSSLASAAGWYTSPTGDEKLPHFDTTTSHTASPDGPTHATLLGPAPRPPLRPITPGPGQIDQDAVHRHLHQRSKRPTLHWSYPHHAGAQRRATHRPKLVRAATLLCQGCQG